MSKKQELLTYRQYMGSPQVFGGGRVVMFLCFVCLRPVSCVSNVVSVFGLSIFHCSFDPL